MSNTSLSTPRGIARFPKLVTPDVYTDAQGRQGKPKYRTELVFDPTDPEAAKFIEQLTRFDRRYCVWVETHTSPPFFD